MRGIKRGFRPRVLGMICSTGMLFQFGGCNPGLITTTTTVDARDAFVQMIRGFVVTPIETYVNAQLTAFDMFVTDRVNNLFD